MAVPQSWEIAGETLDLTGGALVGVLNVTPDSFSDGGEFEDPEVALRHGMSMIAAGAALVDVGGESTRPGARPVDAEVETRRVLPVISALVGEGVRVSVDTSKPKVAFRAVDAGAVVVNDVTGFGDREMVDVVAGSTVGAVVMHMKGEPRTMQANPHYDDVVADVRRFLSDRAASLVGAGVSPRRIAVDPGFGFGKTVKHNMALIGGLSQLSDLGFPVMLGTSRKSTLASLTGRTDAKMLDTATAVTTAVGFERGARIFRVHDVSASRDALTIAAAIVG